MNQGIVVLLCALAVGVLLSVLKSRFDGRFRGTRRIRSAGVRDGSLATSVADRPDPTEPAATEEDLTAVVRANAVPAGDIGAELGDRATLLQFSSAFCAPCRATRRILGEVETMVDGVRHVELDAEAHLELVRRLDILRTPTVLVLDSTGAIVTRASGQPRKADVIAAVGAAVDRQPR